MEPYVNSYQFPISQILYLPQDALQADLSGPLRQTMTNTSKKKKEPLLKTSYKAKWYMKYEHTVHEKDEFRRMFCSCQNRPDIKDAKFIN